MPVPRFERGEEVTTDVYIDCFRFLAHESELLDNRQYNKWLDLLHEDLDYRVPVRTNREQGVQQFSDRAFHLKEDRSSISARIDRLSSEYAWSEDPPPRLRRLVSNVQVDDATDRALRIQSYLLCFRSQGDTSSNDLISADRHDMIRFEDGDWKLSDRTVLLDHTVLNVEHLAMFL